MKYYMPLLHFYPCIMQIFITFLIYQPANQRDKKGETVKVVA